MNNDIVRNYLQNIGRIPLLNQQQEIHLGEQIQARMKLLQIHQELAQELKREPTLKEWAKKSYLSPKLLQQKLKEGQQAKQKMIQANLRLVVSVAKKYQKRDINFLPMLFGGFVKQLLEQFLNNLVWFVYLYT